jgi:hypothetical protein
LTYLVSNLVVSVYRSLVQAMKSRAGQRDLFAG